MKCRNITFRYIGSISISCYWCWWHHHIVSSPPLCSKVITVIALTIKCGAHFNLILQIVPELNEFNLKGVSLLLFFVILIRFSLVSYFEAQVVFRKHWGSFERDFFPSTREEKLRELHYHCHHCRFSAGNLILFPADHFLFSHIFYFCRSSNFTFKCYECI